MCKRQALANAKYVGGQLSYTNGLQECTFKACCAARIFELLGNKLTTGCPTSEQTV